MALKQKHNKYSAAKIFLLTAIAVIVSLTSCNTARRVADGQYLLKHNAIVYPVAANKGKGLEKIGSLTRQEFANIKIPPEIAPQYIQTYIKQKPNTKILGFIPLHLMIYNIVNPEKALEKKLERDKKIDEKNAKRIAQGKPGLSEEKLKAKKARRTWREWLQNAGEPPVLLDSGLLNGSIKQIRLFLQSKGYEDCSVRDSVSVKNKKAKVFFIIRPGKPYKIDSLNYVCEDSALTPAIYGDSANCLINQGDNFDRDEFLKERDRITHYLNDNGYYAFTKDYIKYDIDSTAIRHFFNVTIRIKKYAIPDTINPDSVVTVEAAHPVFHIGNVVLQMQYNPSNSAYSAGDTVTDGDYKMVFPPGEMEIKLKKLLSRVFIKKGDLYKVSAVDYTYTALAQLKTFRYINIKFINAGKNILNCYIQLMPGIRHDAGIEAEATNTGGSPGIQGDLVYDDKNFFKASDIFTVKLKGGFEAQKILSQSTTGINNLIGLNTIDIGPEVDFTIPRPWFPFNIFEGLDTINRRVFHNKTKWGLWEKANPQTVFKATYDFQNRPDDYVRHIFGLAYTFNFDPYEKKGLRLWNIELRLPEINFVHADVLPDFQTQLNNTNNFFLINSFKNHVIPDIAASVVYNTTSILAKKRNHYDFFKFDIEESGYLLRAFTPLFQTPIGGPQFWNPDPAKNYSVFGVPYSYYVKSSVDYRHYFVLSKDDRFVVRILGGIGLPMAGVPQELPFDKSFWAGGANDIRGWDARTLGPGGYNQTTIVDQIGDIKLEANQEYRVSVVKILGLGFFFDEGNVWLLNPNPAVPNGDFKWSGPESFINQIAVAGGIGLRFDFTYFVFRFDLGQPMRDPARSLGNEWIGPRHWSIETTVLNFGIGYPF